MKIKTDRIIISNEERQKATGKKFFIEVEESCFNTKIIYPDIQDAINEIEAFIDNEDVDPIYFKIRYVEMTQKEFEALPEFKGY